MAAVATLFALAAPSLATAQGLGARVLRQGMSGADVRVLQRLLTEAGYPTPAVGSFGPITNAHVRSFERTNQLAVNGIVNQSLVRQLRHVVALRQSAPPAAEDGYSGGAPFTLTPAVGSAALAAPVAGAKPAASSAVPATTTGQLGSRVLHQGMKGADVGQLQGDLTLAGFPTAVDDQFGSETKASVIAFEQAHSLPGDGVVSATVVQALGAAVAVYESTSPTGTARINPDGTATAPAGAPPVVQAVIAAANQIISKPYIFGGGHGSFTDTGYDCSGAVSYALHGGGLIASPEDSVQLETYGTDGPGEWITVYADASHTWVVVAGIAFDTADFGGPNIPIGSGPRWRSNPVGNLADGGSYVIRHPTGY
ncbi:MAG: peptidoglycan-binding protein [Solirubrobacteraceae bacterium]